MQQTDGHWPGVETDVYKRQSMEVRSCLMKENYNNNKNKDDNIYEEILTIKLNTCGLNGV